jgi:hypothetical protein
MTLNELIHAHETATRDLNGILAGIDQFLAMPASDNPHRYVIQMGRMADEREAGFRRVSALRRAIEAARGE